MYTYKNRKYNKGTKYNSPFAKERVKMPIKIID